MPAKCVEFSLSPMLNRIFSNPLVQRSFYLIFLILWSTVLLRNTLEYPKCTSSVGLPYASLYFPVALILLGQTIFNRKAIWGIVFGFFVASSLFMLYDNFLFYSTYRTKMGSSVSDLILSELFLLLSTLTVNAVLYKIRPAK